MIFAHLLLYLLLFCLSCDNQAEKRYASCINDMNALGYDLSRPDKIINLPSVLYEISGITLSDPASVACVQDEHGVIFIVDIVKKEIKKQITFHWEGDYEDIARVDSVIFVLRSDGVLFEIRNYESSHFDKKIHALSSLGPDAESLCYDKHYNRLLITPKSKSGHNPGNENIHPVYGFDLKTGKLIESPVLGIDLRAIKKFAAERSIRSSERNGKIKFKPSALGIHPVTDRLYVLSGIERMLFVFDRQGIIENIVKLDPEIFNMPEGISFFDNGDMLISNEGRQNPPTILIFNHTPI